MKMFALIAMFAATTAQVVCPPPAKAEVITHRAADGALYITGTYDGPPTVVKADPFVSPHATCTKQGIANVGQGLYSNRCTEWTFGAPTKFAGVRTPRSKGFQSLNPDR